MSGAGFDAGMRLASLLSGRAVPRSSCRLVSIHPSATLVAVRTMAGEDGSLWGVGVGRVGDARPAIYVGSDPAINSEQALCIAGIAKEARGDPHPTLVVASRRVAMELDAAAKRAAGIDDKDVAYGASLVSHCVERLEVAGQDSLVLLTEALHAHWLWPTQVLDEASLAATLRGLHLSQSPSSERIENDLSDLTSHFDTGTSTPVELDVAKMAALVRRLRSERQRARERGLDADRQMLRRHRVEVAAGLSLVLRNDWDLLVQGVRALESIDRPALPGAGRRCEAEKRSWDRLAGRLQAGTPMAFAGGPRRNAVGFAEAERAAQAFESELREHDDIARARAAADGVVLVGSVAGCESGADGGTRIIVESAGDVMGWRAGDKMAEVGGRRVFLVAGTDQAGRVVLTVTGRGGLPEIGTQITLVPTSSDHRPGGAVMWGWTHPAGSGRDGSPAGSCGRREQAGVEALAAVAEQMRRG